MQLPVESQNFKMIDTGNQISQSNPATRISWIYLAVAGMLLLFSNGANTIPLAAWLSPIFLLRFVRMQRKRVGIPIAYVVLIAAFTFQFRGMVPIPGMWYYVFLIGEGILFILPYFVDRVVSRRISSLAATVVFPFTWVAIEYLNNLGPFGSWGSAAYSQYGNLPLLQMLSVTGLWGVTFLIGWLAAVSNSIWEKGMQSKAARSEALLCFGTIALIILLGGGRLSLFPPSSQTVRVASMSHAKDTVPMSDTVMIKLIRNQFDDSDREQFHAWGIAVTESLLTQADREARAGAKIIFWAETRLMLLKENETVFIARGRECAMKNQIYLGMSVGVWNLGQSVPFENKIVMIKPNGEIAWEYYKARPVPGIEAALSVVKDGQLPSLDTPFGRLSSVICFDGDFPQLLAQASALEADIIIDPSNDGRAISPWNTQMASFRAIEQGFNLVRPTYEGLSATYDYQGRCVSAVSDFQTVDHVMVSEVSTKGARTLYGKLGDWFAWVCQAGLLLLVGQTLIGRKKQQIRPATLDL